jgi:RNA methyltransferase, TrmH family
MLALVHESSRTPPVISSRQHPLVARFREAARGGAGAPLLLDGPHLVLEALQAGLTLLDVAMSSESSDMAEMAQIRRRFPATQFVTTHVMDALSPTRTPAGVVALADRPVVRDDTMFASASALVVIAVDVQDPGNVGAIVRSAEAAGATGVIATAGGADPLGWKAVRGSMGSVLRLPVLRLPDAKAAIDLARQHGVRCAAAVRDGGTLMDAADLTGPVAIVVGGEGAGLSRETIDASDLRVSIPMAPQVESLNVATAAALLVYEARRQRARR